MGEIKTITFQFNINLYELSEVTASIIKYTLILILNCLQELINNSGVYTKEYRLEQLNI